MPRILKAELAKQNEALRAELSQVKRDMEEAVEQYWQQVEQNKVLSAQLSEAKHQAPAPAPLLPKKQLMEHAKQVAKKHGCTTKVMGGRVYMHRGQGWEVAPNE